MCCLSHSFTAQPFSAGVCRCETVCVCVCVSALAFKGETVREAPPPKKTTKNTTTNSRQAKEWVTVQVWQPPGWSCILLFRRIKVFYSRFLSKEEKNLDRKMKSSPCVERDPIQMNTALVKEQTSYSAFCSAVHQDNSCQIQQQQAMHLCCSETHIIPF